MKVGKPQVGITSSRAWTISSSLAPAAFARAACVTTPVWWRLAAEMPSLMSQRVLSSSGPPCSWMRVPSSSFFCRICGEPRLELRVGLGNVLHDSSSDRRRRVFTLPVPVEGRAQPNADDALRERGRYPPRGGRWYVCCKWGSGRHGPIKERGHGGSREAGLQEEAQAPVCALGQGGRAGGGA